MAKVSPRRMARMSDEALLDTRLCDLDIRIKGTWLEERLDALYGNLANRGLRFKPHVWLADEWFSPAGIPGGFPRRSPGSSASPHPLRRSRPL